jgi:L-threonylcarbamoyladenylate synthase
LPNDPAGYARELYAALYRAERARPARLVILQVPDDDAWATVRDRLLRATA